MLDIGLQFLAIALLPPLWNGAIFVVFSYCEISSVSLLFLHRIRRARERGFLMSTKFHESGSWAECMGMLSMAFS